MGYLMLKPAQGAPEWINYRGLELQAMHVSSKYCRFFLELPVSRKTNEKASLHVVLESRCMWFWCCALAHYLDYLVFQ